MQFDDKPQTTDISIGFSPCPNDTFMFDAMVHHKIDTEGLAFDVVMEDVETLNQMALSGSLDVSKISFAAFLYATGNHQLLNAGSALGKGVGPLLVNSTQSAVFSKADSTKWHFAIPGKHTTANFLFSLFFPEADNKKEMVFSEIENAVLSGEVDAGVIIHENRFTYESKGLRRICDLGELWERETGQPIPLGGIAVKRNLSEELKLKVDRVLRRSIEFAFANPKSGEVYVKKHAQEIDGDIRRKHIEMYVNDFSIDLGEKGRKAIHVLFQKAMEAGLIEKVPTDIFVKDQIITA